MLKKILKLLFYFYIININNFIFSSNFEKKITLEEYFKDISNVIISDTVKNISIKNQIKNIVILCPADMITGGPENLCQIYAALKKQGYSVYFLWVKNYSDISKVYKDGIWFLQDGKDMGAPLYKKNYDVNYLDHEIPLIESTLIVIPEVWSDSVTFFENAKKVISWLSIGFLHVHNKSTIVQNLIYQKRLNCLDCMHISQAPWISKTLQSWGIESYVLGDYISQEYLTDNDIEKSSDLIAFFPRKGGYLATQFIERYPDLDYIKLENLDKECMKSVLEAASIYIDFGAFPGKDRVPREALAKKCVIFIHNVGCATDFESFPIDDYFRFSTEDITNGILYSKVKEVLADYKNMQEKQVNMRNQILQEYDLFHENIKEIFGNPLV